MSPNKNEKPSTSVAKAAKQPTAFLPGSYLLYLGAVGLVLLWGVAALNGTVAALLSIQETGTFPDGRALRTAYTGWHLIDRNLSILVTFFDVLTNENAKRSSSLLVIDLCALLATINTWVVIESRRRGVRNIFLRHTIIAIFLWNSLGAAFIAPLYFYLILKSSHTNRDATIPLNEARGFLPTLVANALFPLLMFLPAWLGWSSHEHQGLIALFSLSPVFMVVVLVLCSRPGTSLSSFATPKKEKNPNEDAPWTIAAWYVSGFVSGLVHLYVVGNAIVSLSIGEIFVPSLAKVRGAELGSYAALQEGVHLFTQFDWWVTAMAVLAFTWLLLGKVPGGSRSVKQLVWMSIGSLVVGPGAAGSVALVAREVRLRVVEASQMRGRQTRTRWAN